MTVEIIAHYMTSDSWYV